MYPPVEKYGISSPYGPRGAAFHSGVDCPCPTGTPLPSVSDGLVVFEGRIPAAATGYQPEVICIVQSEGFFITYGHLSQTLVSTGERVKQGDIIAYSGNTGYVLPKPLSANDKQTGQHLHAQKNLGTKSPYKGINNYPSEDITPLLNAYGGQDMDALEAVRSLYRALDPQGMPSLDALKGHADRVQREGRIDGVMMDILSSKGWRDGETYNVDALTSYYSAAKVENPRQEAINRVLGGDNLDKVLMVDIPFLMEREAPQDPQNDADAQLGRMTRDFVKQALKEAI
jgi:hypothetical protein